MDGRFIIQGFLFFRNNLFSCATSDELVLSFAAIWLDGGGFKKMFFSQKQAQK